MERLPDRNRWLWAGLIIVVIVLGLASRSSAVAIFPDFVGQYGGDVLWALMVFLGLGFLFPRRSVWFVAGCALAFSFAIETSQLSQVSWLDDLRHTRLGALVLGRGFLWSDFASYTVGCGLGTVGELLGAFLFWKKP